MTDEDILRVLGGLRNLWWGHNYQQFCEILGWAQDYYSEQKWLEMSSVVGGLNHFDDGNLVKLVRAGMKE